MISNPFACLEKRDWALWLGSLAVVLLSNCFSGTADPLNIITVCVGATLLIFLAKGNVWGQILTVVFGLLYGIQSIRFRYWGEVLTYVGMTAPMAITATVAWLRHPDDSGSTVAIGRLTPKKLTAAVLSSVIAATAAYIVLKAAHTPNLTVSTLSVFTSFLACVLTYLRSPWYAAAYACNDVVLIVLWLLASLQNPLYIPVMVNFAVFFVNDLYGLMCWRKRAACGNS